MKTNTKKTYSASFKDAGRSIAKLLLVVTTIIGIAALASSCKPLGLERSVLVINISSGGAKILVPGIDMELAGYDIAGAGPAGESFFRTTVDTSTQVPGLSLGDWTITIYGKNAAGTIIAQGEQNVTIAATGTQAIDIAVLPIVGVGSVDLRVNWTAAEVGQPSIQASLTPSSGAPLVLAFSLPAAGTGSCTRGSIPTGYYTLEVKLLDGGQLVMGAIEVVRIVKDQVTSGTFDFTGVGSAKGSLSVNIAPEMYNPITVTLSGQAAEIDAGAPMTVSASVPPDIGNVVQVWYLNGEAKSTGSSITVNGPALPLAAGVYRLDVTAFTTDGRRGGSTTHTFRVKPGAGTSTILAWDASTDAAVVGYKLSRGTSSGSYDTVIDVGLTLERQVTGLTVGQTYYFAVSAYTASGAESAYSNELSCTVN